MWGYFSHALLFLSIFTQLQAACCLPHSFWIMLFSPPSFKFISSFAFLAFENEAEKCMESILPTLLQSLVICDLCVYLLTPFGKSQLYLWLSNTTEQLKQL